MGNAKSQHLNRAQSDLLEEATAKGFLRPNGSLRPGEQEEILAALQQQQQQQRPNHHKKHHTKKSLSRNHKAGKALGPQDIDDIYQLVKSLKEDKLEGEELLEHFMEQRAGLEKREAVPIRSITIQCGGEDPQMSNPSRRTKSGARAA